MVEGGLLAYLVAARTDIDCAVSYFGVGIERQLGEAAHIQCPMVFQFGDYLTAGRPVVAVVSDENWRLVLNLPERHLKGLKVGQGVYCYIGSDPWRIHRGRIRSIAPGVARSIDPSQVLPYVNLSTDWIRLPRRFPVEIDLGDLPKKERLFVGSDANVFYARLP
jgi:multidrug efflux system membrane fusion protein